MLASALAFAESPEETLQTGKKALAQEHNFPKAIAAFKACLDENPEKDKEEECLNLLAKAYWGNNDIGQALWAYGKEIDSGKNKE